MTVAQNHAQTFLSGGVSPLPSAAASDDPVALRLRESARRMIGHRRVQRGDQRSDAVGFALYAAGL